MAPTHVIPKLIVVTAASSNHFGALRQMLESLRRLGARVECYDIGLTADEARALPRWPGFFYHPFDYAAYPAYLNAAVNAGEYAWKPVIVADVIDRARAAGDASDVRWADAGCFFHALHPVAECIKRSGGLWVRTSAGVMREWTHPLMFEYLGVDPAAYGERRNADATLVGFAVGSAPAPGRDAVYRQIVQIDQPEDFTNDEMQFKYGSSLATATPLGTPQSVVNGQAQLNGVTTGASTPFSAGIGYWIGTGRAPRRFFRSPAARRKSAPGRSSLFTNARQGTRCFRI